MKQLAALGDQGHLAPIDVEFGSLLARPSSISAESASTSATGGRSWNQPCASPANPRRKAYPTPPMWHS